MTSSQSFSQMPRSLGQCRSLLFAPADGLERVGKALAGDADLVCADLEDAVAITDKARTRRNLLISCSWWSHGRLGVRINAPTTITGLEDLIDIARSNYAFSFVMVPKCEDPAHLAIVNNALTEASPQPPPVVALIETVRGVEAVHELAHMPGVAGLLFGAIDYTADAGGDGGWQALLFARTKVATTGHAAGVPVIDTPHLDVTAGAEFKDEVFASRSLGFQGKAAIHPRQLQPINETFTPTAQEIEHAKTMLAAYGKGGGGVVQHRGIMIDLPGALRAKALLDQAELSSNVPSGELPIPTGAT